MDAIKQRLEINKKIMKLPFNSALGFGLSCSERLFNNFVKFHTITGWGNPSELREVIHYVWQVLAEEDDYKKIEKYKEMCERNMPETDDFSIILVSSGLDAVSSVLLLLLYMQDKDKRHICDISSLCLDTVDMYVQELLNIDPLDQQIEAKIQSSNLMLIEVERQFFDLDILNKNPIDQDSFHSYQIKWKEPKRSNLGF